MNAHQSISPQCNQDIKGGQSSNNYTYDQLGQLTSDAQISNSYIWRKGDKKLSIQKSLTMQLEFIYNPFGQRVLKIEKALSNGTVIPQSATNRWKYTYYAYDANGQVMATYKLVMDTTTTTFRAELDERMIYGAGRIGVIQETAELIYASNQTLSSVGPVYYNKLGKKNYELTNYLGNVNVVITDRKVVSSNTTVYSFKYTDNGWSHCTQSTLVNGDDALTVNFNGASNCVFKSLTTVIGKTYTISVIASKGGTSGLRIKAFGSSLISTKNLADNQNTIYQFTANSTTTNIIIEPIVYSGSSSYSIDEIAITSDNFYDAVAIMKADYYPFGMQMPARFDANGKVIGGSWQTSNYRYGYNGMEKDNELKDDGNSYTTEFRQYDPRLGRWLSLDPVIQPHQSPFSAMDNNPIMFNDPLGLKAEGWGGKKNEDGSTSWTYDEKLTKDSHEGYDYYMDDGYLFDATNRETGVISDWKLNADGTAEDLNVNSIGEVEIRSSKTSTSAPAENKPYKSWASSSNPLGWNAGPSRNLIDQIAWDKKNVSADIQKRWKINRKSSDNLALLVWGNIAAPLAAVAAVETAPVWVPWAIQGSRALAYPFRAVVGRCGTPQQIQAIYQFGSFGSDAINQIASGNNIYTWNYGSSFGNLYFKNAYVSNVFGAAYSKMQGHSNSYVISNYIIGVVSSKMSDGIKGSEMIKNLTKNPLLQHGSGSFTVPLLINTGSNINPIKE